MGIEDEDAVKGNPQFTLGQDLSTLSVEELRRSIDLLQKEIARIEQEIAAKDSTKATAEAVFKGG
ncbi:DUF1192 domain-containing protein [Nitratireductor thuwali]|uniref:DUF1192 domain-containing protein n=1 Tax=Nitratireductor thuwali TaxID=2267699 RepID=A0ABY5MK50_9HYPH|nr:hypothetical protein NTH_01906 [Nitratireductor thuwali]